jgi:membrane protein YdbS with pleckstrin-like domain
MQHKIRNVIALAFVLAVILFTILALLSIWEIVADDVIWKSLGTLVVLVVSAALIFGIIKLAEVRYSGESMPVKQEEGE